jgi:RNA polymerase sigma-70 factor (ECF subfamily)
MPDPADLWETWRSRRDEAAFEILVRPELPRALAFARSLGCSPEDAEDALQESLARLASERGDGPTRLGVRAWLYRTVKDRARSRRRSWWRRRAREKEAARSESVPAAEPRMGVREDVDRALDALLPDERESVTLRYLQDLDYREMAVVLGVSENACRIRVHRALERLRVSLGPGAATMIASLPLPAVTKGTLMVKAALVSAGTGAAAASGTGAAAGGIAMASGTKIVVAAAAAGALVAGGAGYFLGTGSGASQAPTSAPIAAETAVAPRGTGSGLARGESGTAQAQTTRSGALDGLSPTREELEFLRGALVAERARREAARIRPEDGGLEVFDRVRKSGADLSSVLWDWTAVRGRIRTGEGEHRELAGAPGEDAKPVNLADLAGKSAVIEFGPGRFRFDRRGDAWHTPRASVRSLEIRGAGKDATILLPSDTREILLVPEGVQLDNLLIRDLTIDAEGQGMLLDLRGRASVALENIRLMNSMEGGYGAPLGISGEIFLGARGCDFTGSGSGFGLSVRGGAIALLNECRFSGLYSAVMGGTGSGTGSAVHLLDCVFDGVRVADSRLVHGPGKAPEFPIRVRGGKVLFGLPEMTIEKRKEAWGLPFVAEATGVGFGPATPTCTVGLLLGAIERVQVGEGETIVRVEVDSVGPTGPESLAVSLMNLSTKGTRYLTCRADGSEILDHLPRTRRGFPRPEDLAGVPPMAQVLRLANLPPETAATGMDYGTCKFNGETIPTVNTQAPDPWPKYILDVRTGKDLLGGK